MATFTLSRCRTVIAKKTTLVGEASVEAGESCVFPAARPLSGATALLGNKGEPSLRSCLEAAREHSDRCMRHRRGRRANVASAHSRPRASLSKRSLPREGGDQIPRGILQAGASRRGRAREPHVRPILLHTRSSSMAAIGPGASAGGRARVLPPLRNLVLDETDIPVGTIPMKRN